MYDVTYFDCLWTTWYPKPAAELFRAFHATGSIVKQSAAFNTENKEEGRTSVVLFKATVKDDNMVILSLILITYEELHTVYVLVWFHLLNPVTAFHSYH